MRAGLVLTLFLSPVAFAQDPVGDEAVLGTDQEDRKSKIPSAEKQDKKLETHVFFETEWHEFDDLDFRALDESSDQAILDSDDRNGFAFTGISLELAYRIDPNVRLAVGASYRGLWGNDQIGNVNQFGGFLFFNSLYVEYTPQNWGAFKPSFRIGRQRFELGGLGGAREFVFADNIDAVRIDVPLGKVGRLILLPVDVVGLSVENDDVNFVSYVGQSNQQVFGFRGDRMTRRHGGVLAIQPEAAPGLDVRAYGFYTDIGALGTGSDISYQGRLGNFADNDWIVNTGLRAAYEIAGLVTPYASFDASIGIDRKELVTNDVDATGFAWRAGVVVDKDKEGKKDWGIHAEVDYFEAQGPVYQDNGQQFSHGYVGMKARQVGGLMANRFLGWHPSSYAGAYGVSTSPHETDRKSGTRVVSALVEAEPPGPVSIGVGYWFMQDTGFTALNLADIDTITPPFGYAREEYAAQERLGKVLGHEVSGNVSVHATDNLTFYVQSGVLLPGDFYAVEIGRIAGTALGSSDPRPFWDASAGANVAF